MSILPFAALPAAMKVARQAIAGGTEVGKGFLELMTNRLNATTTGDPSSADKSASPDGLGATNLGTAGLGQGSADSIQQRTESFARRMTQWLRQQPWLNQATGGQGPVSIQLSLDQLDQPHAKLDGQSSSELDAALAKDPGWLEEFRTLALDRMEQHGALDSMSTPQSLTIQQSSVTMHTVQRWNNVAPADWHALTGTE